jgi:uncharacterized iron-regulated protein
MPRRSDSTILTLLPLAACQLTAPATPLPPAERVASYRAAFEADAGTRFVGRMTRADLIMQLASVRVLWLGDHHRSTRLHTLQRELLEQLAASGRPLLFVLEAIGDDDEAAVADYLARGSDAERLRQRVRQRWPGSWLDDPDLDAWHYRSLLALAQRHGALVRALEPTPRLPLSERDRRIGERVRALAQQHPDRLLLVVVGQAHLAGKGDVVARAGQPAIVLGGEPTPALVRAGRATDGELFASDGGLWWFSELLAN